MEKNVGGVDRIVRFVVGGLVSIVGFTALIGVVDLGVGSVLSAVLLVLGLVVFVTAAIQRCPPYSLLGIDTCPVSDRS